MPAKDHWAWARKQAGVEPDTINAFVERGGDIVGLFVKRCRAKGIKPMVGVAMNHGGMNDKGPERFKWVSRFYEENPQLRLKRVARWDWSHAEVRSHRFALLEEVCTNHEVDGVFLDYLRFCHFFETDFPTARRVEIMTEFVRDVRQMLDRTAKRGRKRWLGIRVPHILSSHAGLGIDLPKLVRVGLDFAVVSSYYYTNQHADVLEIRKLIPNTLLFYELTYCCFRDGLSGARRVTTDEQFYTTAHLALHRGVDGFLLFNFVYYRLFNKKEPPWHVVKRLNDEPWLGKQPRWYFLDQMSYYYQPPVPRHLRPMPQKMVQGDTREFLIDMVPPDESHAGVLRLKATRDMRKATWRVSVNGTELAPIKFVRKPIDHPYERGLDSAAHYRCFAMPPRYSKDIREYFYNPPPRLINGYNKVTVKLDRVKGGGSVWLHAIDVVLPTLNR